MTLVPKKVSPFIRACRWTFLLTGIAYGHFRYNYLQKKEVGIQARENKIREKRDARLAGEKKRATDVEMNALAKEAGIVVKAGSSDAPSPASSSHH